MHIWSAGIKKFCSNEISFTALLRQQQKIHSTTLLKSSLVEDPDSLGRDTRRAGYEGGTINLGRWVT